MNRKNPALLLSLAVILSSIAPAAPAIAASVESAPARLGLSVPVAPVTLPDVLSGVDLSAVPQLPSASLSAPAAAAPAAVAAPLPTASPVAAAQQAQAAPASIMGRLSAAIEGKISWTRAFDGAGRIGIRPLPKPVLPQGSSIELGDGPSVPPAGQGKQITLNSFDIPGARNVGEGSIFEAGPRVLDIGAVQGQSTDALEQSVKKALLKLVDSDAARYGVTSSELETVHVKLVKGRGNQADAVFAYFRQQMKSRNVDGTEQNVRVNGSYLSFTVKFVKGKAVLMAAMARLYPNIDAGADATLSDAQAKAKAEQQVLPEGANGLSLVFVERKVVFHKGRWRTVNLYDIEGAPIEVGVNVAVDVKDGEVFAWDSRMGLKEGDGSPAETAQFILHNGGRRIVTSQDIDEITKLVEQAGGKVTGGSHGRFSNNIFVEGGEAAMRAVAAQVGWSIEPIIAHGPAAQLAGPQADPLSLKKGFSQAQSFLQQRGVSDARLIAVKMNLLNKSQVRGYAFYSPSRNAVISVLVNFLGQASARAFMPLPDQDYSGFSLDGILEADKAIALAKDNGVEPVQLHIARRQGALGPHPVEYTLADESGKTFTFVAEKLKTPPVHKLPVPAPKEPVAEVPAPRGPAGDITGTITGRAEENDHRPNNEIHVKEQALPHIEVTIGGKTQNADVNGNYSAKAQAGVQANSTLSGLWAKVQDQQHNDLTASAALTPGQKTPMVFNPDGVAELSVDQVNSYLWVTKIHDWWSARLQGDKRIDQQIPVNVNIDDECNAYYTPGTPSLNFFRSSENCSDTGRPGVVAHEYGHSVDDAIGGITNGGMSEGWGDIGSMFLLNTPIIGEGFLKNQTPSWIRNGENNYQYNASDEVHDQGQAWMGFAWKLRKSLIASLGEAAGTAEAEALIIPTLFAKASDIPSQMAQVLLHAMDKNGKIQYEKEIRAAARAHGIDLPSNPGLISRLWNGLVSAFSSMEMEKVDTQAAVKLTPGSQTAEFQKLMPEDFHAAPAESPAKAVLHITASRGNRAQVKAFIENANLYSPGEHGHLSWTLTEKRGLMGSDFVLELSGPRATVDYFMKQVERFTAGPTPVSAQAAPIQAPTGPMRLAAPNADAAQVEAATLSSFVAELKGRNGQAVRVDADYSRHSVKVDQEIKFRIEQPTSSAPLIRVTFLSVDPASGKASGSSALQNPTGGPAPESMRLLSPDEAARLINAEIAGWRSSWSPDFATLLEEGTLLADTGLIGRQAQVFDALARAGRQVTPPRG